MKTSRKIFLALVLTLVVAAVMCVCAFAFDLDTDLPAGVKVGETGWVNSGYTDIDADNSGWTLIGVPDADYSTTTDSFPTFTVIDKGRFYWHKENHKGVWVVTSSDMSSNSGENKVRSIANVLAGATDTDTTDFKKNLYAFAAAFVDITNGSMGSDEFAAAFDAEGSTATEVKSRYLQYSTSYPVWTRYYTGDKKGIASNVYTYMYVTKAAYQDFIKYKKELVDAGELTGDALNDALVEYAAVNVAPYKQIRNCKEVYQGLGAHYRLAWIFNQLEKNSLPFNSVEFRCESDIDSCTFGTVGYVVSTLEAKQVLIDSKINKISLGATWRGMFRGVVNLTTLAHVTYDSDMSGKYTGTVTDGVIDLSGFTGVTTYSSGAYMLDRAFYGANGITKVVYFNTLKSGDTEHGGWVDVEVFANDWRMTSFTMNAPLTKISSNAFVGCNALKTLDLKGGVASGATIATNAFSTSVAIEALVYDATSKTNLETALTTAGYTNITVTLVEEGGEEEEPATMPEGVDNTSDQWIASGYTDVDTEDGWYLIGKNEKDTSTTTTTYPTFAYLENARFYWNKTTGEGVWLVVKDGWSISGSWGEEVEATGTKNVLEDGVFFYMAWVFNKLQTDGYVFESIEFRMEEGCSCKTFSTAGLILKSVECKKILFDTQISYLNLSNNNRGLFMYNAALTTFDHVDFKADGTYDETVTPDVVDLRGFTTFMPHSNDGKSAEFAFSYLLYQSGIKEVIWFDSIISQGDISSKYADYTIVAGDEMAGFIDDRDFSGAASLTKVTLSAPLTDIAADAFNNCSSFTTLDLKGGIAAGAEIVSTAFNNVKAVEIIVYSVADELRAQALFTDSKYTITNMNPAPEELTSAITADGFSIRLNDENAKTKGPALRAEFTLYTDAVNAAKELGYTLSNYGVVVFSENTLNSSDYNGDLAAIFEAAKAGTDTRIIIKSAKNGPYVNGEALEADPTLDKTFAAAVTGIKEGNYTSAVYTYAFAMWTNGDEVTYTYVTYTSERTGKTAHSLYDATLFAFRNGIANSQNTDDDKLWPILEKGAFSITDGDQKAFADGLTLNVAYSFTDEDGDSETANTFTYLNLPLRAWIFGNLYSDGRLQWYSAANRLEETSSTNVVWSLLVDTMADGTRELVVAYRRAPGIDESAVAKLPQIRDRGSTGGFAPYSSSYFTPGTTYGLQTTTTGNGLYNQATIYSPILSDDNEALIKTLVIDYGISVLSTSALENTTVSTLKTIVYPEGMTAGASILAYNYPVTNMIYASENKTSLTAATQVDGFGGIIDLSGFATMSANYAFTQLQNAENIILPESVTYENGYEELFYNAYKIKRVWTVGNAVPADGTIDLTGLIAKSFAKNCFAALSKNATVKNPTILMPATFEGVSSYGYKFSEAGACSQTFGVDAEYTIVLSNAKALTGEGLSSGNYSLMAFYENMLAANADLDGNGTIGDKVSLTNIVYELKDSYADNLDHLNITATIVEEEGELTKTFAEWKTYFDEKAAEEAERLAAITTPLNYYRGVNVNGLEDPSNISKLWSAPTLLTSESTYTNIVSQGFDHVRIPVPFHLYYDSSTGAFGKYNYKDYMPTVDTAIDLAIENGLGVILDFHGWYEIDPTNEDDKAKFKACWQLIAERYKDYGTELMFELMNEPHYNGTTATLINFELEVVDIIRATGGGNERRLILIAGPDSNAPWKLNNTSSGPINLPVKVDPNLIMSVHIYDPGEFTHQGCTWANPEYTSQVALTEAHMSSVRWNLNEVKAFVERTGIRVMITEIGMNVAMAAAADTDTYVRTMSQFCHDNDYPLCWWSYDGGDFALYSSNSWRTAVLDAIFLR